MKRSPSPATEETTHGVAQANCSAGRSGRMRSTTFMARALLQERVSYPRRESLAQTWEFSAGRKICTAQITAEMATAIAKDNAVSITDPIHQTTMRRNNWGVNLRTGCSHI